MQNLLWRGIARVVSQPKVVDWLIRRAKKRPFTHIPSNENPSYMERYWLFNPYPVSSKDRKRWQFPISIRLHWIKRADAERHLHDHPWNARTIILRGWYGEHRLTPAGRVPYTRQPGDTATLKVGEYHTITDVPVDGVWTMFISGPWRADWGFLVDGVKVWWREYLGLAPKSPSNDAEPGAPIPYAEGVIRMREALVDLGPLAQLSKVEGERIPHAFVDDPVPNELLSGESLTREEANRLSIILRCPHCRALGCKVCDPDELFGWVPRP